MRGRMVDLGWADELEGTILVAQEAEGGRLEGELTGRVKRVVWRKACQIPGLQLLGRNEDPVENLVMVGRCQKHDVVDHLRVARTLRLQDTILQCLLDFLKWGLLAHMVLLEVFQFA